MFNSSFGSKFTPPDLLFQTCTLMIVKTIMVNFEKYIGQQQCCEINSLKSMLFQWILIELLMLGSGFFPRLWLFSLLSLESITLLMKTPYCEYRLFTDLFCSCLSLLLAVTAYKGLSQTTKWAFSHFPLSTACKSGKCCHPLKLWDVCGRR